jgi:hypothetical protein
VFNVDVHNKPDDDGQDVFRLTPEQQRQMEALGAKNDRVTQADAKFFERFPNRKHRVRLTAQAEIRQREIVEGEAFSPPPFWCAYTVVRNIAPGVRLRLFTYGPEDSDTDVDEATACAIFEAVATPRTREIETRLRKFVEARA